MNRAPGNFYKKGQSGAEKLSGERRKAVLTRLWHYLKQMKKPFIVIAILVVVSNVLSLIGPKLTEPAINAIVPGSVDFPTVFYYASLMVICYISSALITMLHTFLMATVSKKITFNIRRDLFNKLSRLPVKFFDTHQSGEVISTLSYDVDTVSASLSADLIHICTAAITITGSFIMMLSISRVLLIIFLFTIPASILFSRWRAKKGRPLFRERSGKLGELNGYAEESIGGFKTIKAYNREKQFIERFDVKNEAAIRAYYRSDYHACLAGPSVNFINNLSLALISLFGALLYLHDPSIMSLGAISSFVLYSRKFSAPINEITNIYSEIQSALAAGERVFRLMDEPEEEPDREDAITDPITRGEVEFRNVSFGYTEDKTILHNLNLKVEPGSLIAIVGPTGAGKTTMVNLLMRFYDVGSGQILIDGVDIRDRSRDELRRAFTMVLQDTWLFNGTVYENIAYGSESATEEAVMSAARAAKINGFIEALPNEYQTVLTDNGTNISKGQKQLLTIARAMLPKSVILILDEATSNVDTQTEATISEAMTDLMKGKTCFVIAHRLSTIKNADTILVMKNGDIVESGTHDELLSRDGAYAELYNSQYS